MRAYLFAFARSTSVQSSSCPIADTIGVTHAAAARTTPSIGKTDQVQRAAALRNDDHINVRRHRLRIASDFRRHCAPCMHVFNSEADSRPAEPALVAISPQRKPGAHITPIRWGIPDRHMRLVKQPFLSFCAALHLLAEVAFFTTSAGCRL